jgi:hypothetical protein
MINRYRSDTRTIAAIGQERGVGSILICSLMLLQFGTILGTPFVGLAAWLGVSGLEQEVILNSENNMFDQDNGDDEYLLSPVSFSNRFYWSPDLPEWPPIVFTNSQLQLLDDVSSFHHSAVLGKLLFSFACMCMGLTLLPGYCKCCFQDDLLFKVMIFPMPFFQLLACCFAMGSYTTLKNHSSLCGPYYVELPYARYNESIYGTDVIVHDDIGMTCKFGSDFYWALGLAIVIVLEITILGVMFVKDKQKRQIYTPGEAIELSITVNEDDDEGGEDDNDDPFHDGMQEL